MSGPVATPPPPAPAPAFPEDWLWQQRHAATSLADVERLFPGRFDLSRLDRPGIEAAIALYGMRATPYYLALAQRAGPDDPVWALAVPDPRETRVLPIEREDPIGDEAPHTRPVEGVTRRYADRALLFPTPLCAVHCRHCFRKRLVGRAEYALDEAQLQAALHWIGRERALREVILTGGDPLMLSDEKLLALLARLAAVPHLRSLRIHTRLPVLNPYRVGAALAAGLAAVGRPVTLVTHFNHPVELSPAARAGLARLRAAGLSVLNQAVLLAGINDDPEVHRQLLWELFEAGVRPYALHQADLVPGTSHLRAPLERGTALMRALRGTVPGHLLPQYLLDIPGGHGKVPLDYPWARPGVQGGLALHAPDGTRQAWRDH